MSGKRNAPAGVPTDCPLCGVPLVQPTGPLDADLLLVGDMPGWREKQLKRPFVGETGDVLRQELLRIGIQMDDCRRTNLWLHDPTDNEEELHLHRGWLLPELNRHPLIFLMGASVVSYVSGGRLVTEVCGLPMRGGVSLPPKTLALASVNPALVFKEGSTVGEFKLAIDRLKEAYSKLKRRKQ
jgi:uracil-DNA glycosylase family 4